MSRFKFTFECVHTTNQIKWELCNVIDTELTKLQMTPKQAAAQFGTTESIISLVRNKKLDKVTFNQLFRYLVILNPNVRILIAPY